MADGNKLGVELGDLDGVFVGLLVIFARLFFIFFIEVDCFFEVRCCLESLSASVFSALILSCLFLHRSMHFDWTSGFGF